MESIKLARTSKDHRTAPVFSLTNPRGMVKNRANGGLRMISGLGAVKPTDFSNEKTAAELYGSE